MTVTYATPVDAGVKVGDFFYSSWGYDQTNIDFWKVVGLTPKGMKVQKWTTKLADEQHGAPYADSVVPGDKPYSTTQREAYVDGEFVRLDEPIVKVAPIEQKRIQMIGDKPAAAWTSFAGMYLWSGQPKSKTNSLYGH